MDNELDRLKKVAELVDDMTEELEESIDTSTSANAILNAVFRAAMKDNSFNFKKHTDVAHEFYLVPENKAAILKYFYMEFTDAFGGSTYFVRLASGRQPLGTIPKFAKFMDKAKVNPRAAESSIDMPLEDGDGRATRTVNLTAASFADLNTRALGNAYSLDQISKAYNDFFKALDVLGAWDQEHSAEVEAERAATAELKSQSVVKRVAAAVKHVYRDMSIGEETINPAYAIGWLAGILGNIKAGKGYVSALIPNRLETGRNYLETFDFLFRDAEGDVVVNDEYVTRGSSEFNPGGSAKDQGFVFTLHIPSEFVSGAPEYLTRTISNLANPIAINPDAQVQPGVLQSNGSISNVEFVGSLVRLFGFRFGPSPLCAPTVDYLVSASGINKDMVKHGYEVGKAMALGDLDEEDPYAQE